MAKSFKEVLNKRIKKKKKKQNIEQKKRENIVCIMRMREKKNEI
jgi:hypothetical protein